MAGLVLWPDHAQATHQFNDDNGYNGPCTPYIRLSASLFDSSGRPIPNSHEVHEGEYFGQAKWTGSGYFAVHEDDLDKPVDQKRTTNRQVLGLNIELRRANNQGSNVGCAGQPPPGNMDTWRQATRVTPIILPSTGQTFITVEIDYRCLGEFAEPGCTETTSASIGPFISACSYTPNWDMGGEPIIRHNDQPVDPTQRTIWMAVGSAYDGKFLADEFVFDWGDGSAQETYSRDRAIGSVPPEERAIHQYDIYGDYTFTYFARTFCFESPPISVAIPVHKYEIFIRTFRAEPDLSIQEVFAPEGVTVPRLELTNGQQGLSEAQIIDENGRIYEHIRIFNFGSENIHFPEGETRPRGQTFSNNNTFQAKYLYVPFWDSDLKNDNGDHLQHRFDVPITAEGIKYQGSTVRFVVGNVVNYFVSRPVIEVSPQSWDIVDNQDSIMEYDFNVIYRNSFDQNKDSPSVTFTWEVESTKPWLTAPSDQFINQTLAPPPQDHGSFKAVINTTGLAPGTYHANLMVDTNSVTFPTESIWRDAVGPFNDVKRASDPPITIPVSLTISPEPPGPPPTPSLDLDAIDPVTGNRTEGPITVPINTNVTLIWESTNTDEIIDTNIPGLSIGPDRLSDSQVVLVDRDSSYFIKMRGGSLEVIDTVNINVDAGGPPPSTKMEIQGLFIGKEVRFTGQNIRLIYDGRITSQPPLGFLEIFLPSLSETLP